MEPWKGHLLHLEALSLLKDLPGWVCWQVGGAQTAGEDNYERGLKKTASRLGISERVRFLGQRTDVARLLAAADIFCQPNAGPEPFGISFIEALYAHLPVITTDLGGAPEIVDDSVGLLVQPNNPVALANALKLLVEDRSLRRKLGEAGFARATTLCDVSSQLNRLQKYFSE
jgi:glycosyltransferase involved in cell wall biosynthesis